jgi:hypothetical protein
MKRDPEPTARWGYKWHFVTNKKDTKGRKNKTVCGLILHSPGSYEWEVGKIEDAKAKDMCPACLGPLVAEEIKTK